MHARITRRLDFGFEAWQRGTVCCRLERDLAVRDQKVVMQWCDQQAFCWQPLLTVVEGAQMEWHYRPDFGAYAPPIEVWAPPCGCVLPMV